MPAYKDPLTGRWFASFYYQTWEGTRKKKKKKGFTTKREALEYERYFLDKSTASPEMKFGSLIELYLEHKKGRCRDSSFDTTQRMINNRILPFFKDIPVNKIDIRTIDNWQRYMMDTTYMRYKGAPTKKLSPVYLANMNNQLSSIFIYAQRYLKLTINPVKLAEPLGCRTVKVERFWTLDEFKLFIAIVKKNENIMYETLLTLMFFTGCRIGEILALQVKDFQDNSISIIKSISRNNRVNIKGPTKTPTSVRSLPLPSFLVDLLNKYINVLYEPQPEQQLFPITRSAVDNCVKRNAKQACLQPIRLQDFRHSHASLLINMGASPLAVQDRLGHKNVKTTLQTYSHLYKNKSNELADKLQSEYEKNKK